LYYFTKRVLLYHLSHLPLVIYITLYILLYVYPTFVSPIVLFVILQLLTMMIL